MLVVQINFECYHLLGQKPYTNLILHPPFIMAVKGQNFEIHPTSDVPTERMVRDRSQNSPEIEVSRSVDI